MRNEPTHPGAGDDLPVDEVMRNRLAKLRTMPVDTTRLDALLRAEVGPRPSVLAGTPAAAAPAVTSANPTTSRSWWASHAAAYRAVAASAAILAILAAAFVLTRPEPALARDVMVQVHEDMVAGRIPTIQVDSIEAANRALKDKWPAGPGVPSLPAEHVMKCCMRDVGDKRLACVLMTVNGTPVSMAVANAGDIHARHESHGGTAHTINGKTYTAESLSGLTMIMTEQAGKSICIMGRLPQEQLLDLASKMEF